MTSRLVAALHQEARVLVPRERHAEAEGLDRADVAVAIHRPDLEAVPAARHLPQRRAVGRCGTRTTAPPSRRYEKSSRSASVYFQRSTPLKAMLTLPSGGASAAFDLARMVRGGSRSAVGS